MTVPKLILINGFAGAGKTTIAKWYIDDHPLALKVESDELVVNIGHWLQHDPGVWELVFRLVKSLADTHLATGHDVVLPYHVRDARHAAEFEAVAGKRGAAFYEFLLHDERSEAIARLLQRGTWGEAGAPPIINDDLPEIERLVDGMAAEAAKRPNLIPIELAGKTAEDTYHELMSHIG